MRIKSLFIFVLFCRKKSKNENKKKALRKPIHLFFLLNLFRFWETDIRAVRKTNRSTIRRKTTVNHMMSDGKIPQ